MLFAYNILSIVKPFERILLSCRIHFEELLSKWAAYGESNGSGHQAGKFVLTFLKPGRGLVYMYSIEDG